MKKQRIIELDFFRTIAFLAVVLQHVLGAYQRSDILEWESAGISVLFLATKFAVPAFVFASGLVLFYNYFEDLNCGRFLLKRIKEILVPYVLWSFLYYLYYNRSGSRSIAAFFRTLIFGEATYHLWYIVMIFQFYLFFPVYTAIFKGIMKFFKAKGRIAAFGVFTFIYCAYILLPSYFLPYGIIRPQNSIIKFLFADYITRNSISYIFYFVLGGVVALNLEKYRELLKQKTVALVSMFTVVFIALEILYYNYGFKDGKISLTYPSFFKPHYFVLTVLFIFLLYRSSLSRMVNRGLPSRVFKFIGDNSFQAYLAHVFGINIFAKVIYNSGISFRPAVFVLIFLGGVVIALCIAIFLRLIKSRTKALFDPLNKGK